MCSGEQTKKIWYFYSDMSLEISGNLKQLLESLIHL